MKFLPFLSELALAASKKKLCYVAIENVLEKKQDETTLLRIPSA